MSRILFSLVFFYVTKQTKEDLGDSEEEGSLIC